MPDENKQPADARAEARRQHVALRHWLPLASALVRAIVTRDLPSVARVIEELLKLLGSPDPAADMVDIGEQLLTRSETHALMEPKPDPA